MENNKKSAIILSRKKLFLVIITTVMITLFAEHLISNILKPFRFESFNTAEELKQFLEQRYNKGSDIAYIINDIKKAGGNCGVFPRSKNDHLTIKYDRMFGCGYWTDFLSLSPFIDFRVFIFTNDENEILEIETIRNIGPK
jgi:hypothetical protein